MIKTKTAFIIFAFLTAFTFPYLYLPLILNSDFFSVFTPGRHNTLYYYPLLPAVIKFILLMIICFFYWKLSKITNEINFKKIIIHFLLTVPGIIFSKINLYQLLYFHSSKSETFMFQIQTVVFIRILGNILFFLGLILFGIYYKKIKKNQIDLV
ncbi:hypothetical protein IRZ71_23380 [Flavobacterium sp. ANB]|uniref:hypothetical protein n=1 Tax=unclassified Flavobacterium TaxID=196869 RepID=UPI0012B857F8|nr:MULTISPECIES: hypothetical protein [unclassified Flavobacterium]MBF4519300.1 hypothetical protein [Flavobacterium sp. ANB]MTD72243.1 hypothetical protein [Flavobacterium sp. LC2016-13]